MTLVLGAGGAVGRAFHAGVLRALAERYRWDARSADLIIGTSAGAQIGALLRSGWTAEQLFHRASSMPRQARARRSFWPASPAYLRRVARQPWRARLGPLVAALLPEGPSVDDRLGAGFSANKPWPARPLWIPAIHLDSGERVVFGRAGAPAVGVTTAVCCSSAVPGLSRPMRVAGERYVDGGLTSATNADLAGQAKPRVVVVLSPLSRFVVLRRMLRRELHALARDGIEIVLFEPGREIAAAMGWNPMSPRRAPAVAQLAYRATLDR